MLCNNELSQEEPLGDKHSDDYTEKKTKCIC